jgi:hypothetical protein
MKKLVFSMFFVLQVVFAWSQEKTGSVTGKVVDAKTQKALENVVVSVQNTTLTALTNQEGIFLFGKVSAGEQLLEINSMGFVRQLLTIEVTEGTELDLGTIIFEVDLTAEQQMSLITIIDNDLGDDGSGSESTAGLLQATRDVFQQSAAFNWGQARFRIRGLDNEYGRTMINGILMDKIYDGRPQFGNWGGLNDATRNQEFTAGSTPSDYTFGSALGTQEINTRASIYRPGTRLSFASTNTNYMFRTMATHSSGMDKNGWAYVISAGRRWAQEGYFEGTDYAANSFFASVEKKINDNHSIDFTAIYAQNSRGRNSANTQEITDLAGIKYNSLWGFQDGKKRNSRDRDVEEPIFILSHYWKISEKTKLNTNLSYQFGAIGNSRLDFNGANNPDPIYYRNLPSFYTTQHDDFGDYVGDSPANLLNAENSRVNFLNNRQIDWAGIYDANINNGGQSTVILFEDRTDDKQLTANAVFASQLSDNIILNAGGTYRKLRSENFQNVLDLLGGDFFPDVDIFFNGDAAQPNLLAPNRNVVEGDRFGYNYLLHADVFNAFTQFKFSYNKIDFYVAQTFSKSVYQREGLYQNGIYPTNSLGKSAKADFENFGFKGGLTYKITGRHFLDFNALYMTNAPTMRNTFPIVRLNNAIVADLESESIQSMDASYIIRMPKLKAKITGFYSKVQNATDIGFFYSEGVGVVDAAGVLFNGSGDAFVAEIVTGIDKRNIGAEFGLEYQLTSTIKLTGTAAHGQYTFDNNPNVKLSVDNVQRIIDYGEATMKNYKQAGTPQTAYALGIEYRDPNFWNIGINANYLDNAYIDVSPLLRTNNFFRDINDPQGLPFYGATEEEGRKILKQEKFDPIRLINLTGGKSWRISKKNRNTIGFFASVNNLFDLQYKTGGFEQARNANFQEIQQDMRGPARAFGPRYFYGFGRTYFINLYVNL